MRKPVLVVGALAALTLVGVSARIVTAGAESDPSVYEAEASASTLAGGARVMSCRGCSGGKDVGWVGHGGVLTLNNIQSSADGPATLTISYTVGGRSAELSVNGSGPIALTFPATSGYRPATKTVDVTLKKGTNTLRFGNPSGWAPDFDKVRVEVAAEPVPSVSEEPAPTTSPVPTSPAPTPADPTPTPSASSDPILAAEAEVLRLVNVERANATPQCAPVALSAQLAEAARGHSEDMAKRGYFDHNTPEGVTPWTRITNTGYSFRTAGENIAKGQRTPADVMYAWMNSSGHKANILNCAFTELGVGLAYDSSTTPLWTQDFAAPR